MSTGMLQLSGIGRTYPGPPRVQALTDADLVIDRHEFVAVTGASGSGKSTLLNILGLLDRPTAGEYLVHGRQISRARPREIDRLRSQVFGFVFQSSHMLPERTVAANVAMPLRVQGVARATRTRAVGEALDQVGLLHRAPARTRDLSGGERQRAAIARALVSRPQIVLADEPTGNLDAANAANVMALLDGLNRRGMTIVVITHSSEVASMASRRVELADGRVRG